MFKNRSFIKLVGLVIAVLAILSIGTLAFTQQTPSVAENNRLAPLDWYFSHDHATIDGNDDTGMQPLAPLDWYFSHDHAIIGGNNDTGMQPRAPRTGWAYRYDSATNKWYAYHYEATPAGLVIDEPYELQNGPGNSGNGCGLNRTEPDC